MKLKGKTKKQAKTQAYPVRYVILTKRIDNGDEEVFNLEDGDGKTVFKTKEEAKRLLKHDTKTLIELYDNAKDIQCHYTLDEESVEVTIPIGKGEIFVRAKIVGI
jgi:predicted peroxiredoxin